MDSKHEYGLTQPSYADFAATLPEAYQDIMKASPWRYHAPPTPSLLVRLLKENLVALGATGAEYSSQAAASQMGYLLEEFIAKAIEADDKVTGKVYLGSGITARLKACKAPDGTVDGPALDAVVTRFHLDPTRAEEIASGKSPGSRPSQSASMPDVVVIDTDSGGTVTISCTEIKASGNNDSSSVPKNLDKLAFDTKNSAVSPWRHLDPEKVRRAVWIAAAEPDDPCLARWRACARDVPGVSVVAWDEGYQWLTGAACPDYRLIPEMVAWSKALDISGRGGG